MKIIRVCVETTLYKWFEMGADDVDSAEEYVLNHMDDFAPKQDECKHTHNKALMGESGPVITYCQEKGAVDEKHYYEEN